MQNNLKKHILVFITVSQCLVYNASAQSSWAERFASATMKKYPDSIVVRKYTTHGPSEETVESQLPNRPSTWNYEIGVVLNALMRLSKVSGDNQYNHYAKKVMDHFITADGNIRTYELTEFNIDHITPGVVLLSLYEQTKEEKYKKAADHLRQQLEWQPRTKEGGFWHKLRYPYQMWLDGLYMGAPFYAYYGKMHNQRAAFDDIINQFVWMEKHARDSRTGLLYHAWDETKLQRWANSQTGQSSQFWSRGMGWYAMALVDVLDYIPANNSRRVELVEILNRLAAAVVKYQDNPTGLWYQVTDKGNHTGNYLEASGSAMFVYALAKGARLGYIDKSYYQAAEKGFHGIGKNFIKTDADGTVHYLKTCSGAGLGGDPYRDGSYEYYIKEPLRTDDLKGIGPFIQASIEIELLKK